MAIFEQTLVLINGGNETLTNSSSSSDSPFPRYFSTVESIKRIIEEEYPDCDEVTHSFVQDEVNFEDYHIFYGKCIVVVYAHK